MYKTSYHCHHLPIYLKSSLLLRIFFKSSSQLFSIVLTLSRFFPYFLFSFSSVVSFFPSSLSLSSLFSIVSFLIIHSPVSFPISLPFFLFLLFPSLSHPLFRLAFHFLPPFTPFCLSLSYPFLSPFPSPSSLSLSCHSCHSYSHPPLSHLTTPLSPSIPDLPSFYLDPA